MIKTTHVQKASDLLNHWAERQLRKKHPWKYWMTYFIQGRVTGLVKIGRTKDLIARLKEIQAHSPDRIMVLQVVAGDVERNAHRLFRHLRMHGEWFNPGVDLMNFIEKLPPTTHSKGVTEFIEKSKQWAGLLP